MPTEMPSTWAASWALRKTGMLGWGFAITQV